MTNLKEFLITVNVDVCNIIYQLVAVSASLVVNVSRKRLKITERYFHESRVNTSTGKYIAHAKTIFVSIGTKPFFFLKTVYSFLKNSSPVLGK